ncbi:MAG: hypothetical protein H6845_00035 [Alphaproteobacteria bacterium]|nr:MAG: hypothetical protein H6845_00035 [Alphaproteobacteria bacterium]
MNKSLILFSIFVSAGLTAKQSQYDEGQEKSKVDNAYDSYQKAKEKASAFTNSKEAQDARNFANKVIGSERTDKLVAKGAEYAQKADKLAGDVKEKAEKAQQAYNTGKKVYDQGMKIYKENEEDIKKFTEGAKAGFAKGISVGKQAAKTVAPVAKKAASTAKSAVKKLKFW